MEKIIFLQLHSNHYNDNRILINPHKISAIRENDDENCEIFLFGNSVVVAHGYNDLIKMFDDLMMGD